MKISGVKNYRYEPMLLGFADFFEALLGGDREGQVETAQATATAALEALGRLCEILTEKGLLNKDDIVRIVGREWESGEYEIIKGAPK